MLAVSRTKKTPPVKEHALGRAENYVQRSGLCKILVQLRVLWETEALADIFVLEVNPQWTATLR
jgi:hypothetical protein